MAAFITMSPPDTEQGPVIKGLWDLSPPTPHGSLADGSIDFKALAEDGIDGTWVLCPQTTPALHAAKHLKIFSPSHTLSTMRLEDRTKQMQFAPGGKPAKWSNEAVLYLADMFPATLARMGAMETSRLLALEGEKGSAKEHDGSAVWPVLVSDRGYEYGSENQAPSTGGGMVAFSCGD